MARLPLPIAEESQLTPVQRRARASLLLGWPVALGGASLLLSLGDIPLCAFRQLTGRPCPLCGGTRACAALAEGDLLAAWQAHPGLLPLIAIAAAHSVQIAHEAWSGRPSGHRRINSTAWLAGGVYLTVNWLLRLWSS